MLTDKENIGLIRPDHEVMRHAVIHIHKKAAVSGLCWLLGMSRSRVYAMQVRLAQPTADTQAQFAFANRI